MSLHIRKLLSRKFNIVFLNLAGLLTCVLLITFPSHTQGSGFEVFNKHPPLGTKLTVAGTAPDFHWIPF